MDEINGFQQHLKSCSFCSGISKQESFDPDELCEAGEAYWLAETYALLELAARIRRGDAHDS